MNKPPYPLGRSLKPNAPLPEAAIWCKACDWLIRLSMAPHDLTQALQILLGAWICESVLADPLSSLAKPIESSNLLELACKVALRLQSDISLWQSETPPVDTQLFLIAHHILGAYGIETEHARAFTTKLEHALHAVGEVSEACVGAALLIQSAGGHTAPLSRPLPIPARMWLTCDREQLRDQCGKLAAATRYGAAPGCFARDRLLHSTLRVLIFQSLREYELDIATTLIRALKYVDAIDSRLSPAIEFLLDQQDNDGHFGYYSLETSGLNEQSELSSPGLQLYLPVTVSTLWTLKETTFPRSSLFHGSLTDNGVAD
jgi:hypothetical protein